jgi:thiamine biosynthesis lipoprotein
MSGSITDPGETVTEYAAASWRALGTYVQLIVANSERLDSAMAATSALLDEVDHVCSRFREDSDLCRANRQAGSTVVVSPLLAQALTAALDAARATDGLLDPTLGRRMTSLGYDDDIEVVRERADPAPATTTPQPLSPRSGAWRNVEVDLEGSVLVPAGVALDLGSIGKAFAADLIASRIPTMVGTDLLVSLGGDVAVGRSEQQGTDHRWRIGVGEAPDGEIQQMVEISEGGVATSSTIHRRWQRGAEGMHHVLDPRSGLPAREVWRTVTVAAPSCVKANTASTVSLVLGEEATAWLEERGLPARLVRGDGSVMCLGGWPSDTPPPPDSTPDTTAGGTPDSSLP